MEDYTEYLESGPIIFREVRIVSNKIVKCMFNPGQYNNYLLAGNVCNAFALGELGSVDDFFLVGAEPPDESGYPLLTGNILDSEGNVLFRLVQNILLINPGHCSKIVGNSVGYEVHDSAGETILAVKTKFEPLPEATENGFVTTLKANFYNKNGELVFSANSGEPDEKIEASCKKAFGFSGGFGLVGGYNDEELDLARVALSTRGKVHRLLSGITMNEGELDLDGVALKNTRLENITIHVRTGNFLLLPGNHIEGCKFLFHGEAANIHSLVKLLEPPEPPEESASERV